ncbi:hypothetical protein ACH5RR_036608 [Cinchona calisaya]|uniref:cyclin-dependent kinase n=1 Tax=Cinchona calisaya TaxID=153742 RepID=A0ABD2Y895_9GENT
MVVENLEMDLYKFIEISRDIQLNQAVQKRFLYQLLSGLSYFHSLGLVHYDLKPFDLLLDVDTKVLKLSTFGCGLLINEDSNPQFCNVSYSAPEVLPKAKPYSTSADMWPIGCIFVEMMAKKQKGQVNRVQVDQEDVYIEEVTMEDDDTSLDQPIGGLMSNARHHLKQLRINVYVPPVDYGAITVAMAQAFLQ